MEGAVSIAIGLVQARAPLEVAGGKGEKETAFPREQLEEGGKLVVPRGSRWGQELVLVVRTAEGPRERASVPCRFVPLVGEEGFGDD